MTTPNVIEVPAQLEPVEPDPFIEALPRSPDTAVRLLLRVPADRPIRNGRTAGATDRV